MDCTFLLNFAVLQGVTTSAQESKVNKKVNCLNDNISRWIYYNKFLGDNTKDEAFLIARYVTLMVVFVVYAFHSPRKVFSILRVFWLITSFIYIIYRLLQGYKHYAPFQFYLTANCWTKETLGTVQTNISTWLLSSSNLYGNNPILSVSRK